jgi:hypothetical protein
MVYLEITKSKARNKRYKAIFIDKGGNIIKTVNFGSAVGQTYIDHGDKKKKLNYIRRHSVNEDWTDYYSAGALSRYILWGPYTDIQKNIDAYNKRLGI